MGRKTSAVSAYGVGMTTNQTVYGGQSAGGFISTLGGNLGKCNECLPYVPFITSLTDFASFLVSLRSTIDLYFPATNINAPIIGKLGVTATVNIRLYTRLIWLQKYTPIYGKFDMTSIVHINLLKDIYVSTGYDWTTDPLLKDWPNNLPA